MYSFFTCFCEENMVFCFIESIQFSHRTEVEKKERRAKSSLT